MKKIEIIVLLLATFAISCTKQVEQMDEAHGELVEYDFYASMSDDTKTILNDDFSVNWAKGDTIYLYSTDGGGIHKHGVENDCSVVHIPISLPLWSKYLVAACGCGSVIGNKGTECVLSGVWGENQTGSFSDCHLVIAKTCDLSEKNLSFHNVPSIVKFSFDREDVSKIVFCSNNEEILHGFGKISVKFDGEKYSTDVYDKGGSSITVDNIGKGTFYLSTFPTTLSKGFSVECYDVDGKWIGSIQREAKLELPKNTVIDLGVLDSRITTKIMIPDKKFKSYLVSNFDLDGDGEISKEEALSVKAIDCSGMSISSLKGLEHFAELLRLDCGGNQLSSLDLSSNVKLDTLSCVSNQLASLDLSKNTELEYLMCQYNQLSSLDISQCKELELIDCGGNQLSSLDISNNAELSSLYCGGNQLSSLDISNNTELSLVDCGLNQLSSLDVSSNASLAQLGCCGNQLSSLDLSKNTELSSLDCSGNKLSSLDLSMNNELELLYCESNQLSRLELGRNTELSYLTCQYNQLSSLDISQCKELELIDCGGNQLTSLDVSNNAELSSLYCGSNQLSSLDISNNTELSLVDCGMNQLSSLDVSNNTGLVQLGCCGNQLSELNLSWNSQLTFLECHNNNLDSLDVTHNRSLTYLNCGNDAPAQSVLREMMNSTMKSARINDNVVQCINSDGGSGQYAPRKKQYYSTSSRGNRITYLDLRFNTQLSDLVFYVDYEATVVLGYGQQIENFTYNPNTTNVEHKSVTPEDFIPAEYLKLMKEHMTFYEGTTPPQIDGTYLIEPMISVYCQDGVFEPGTYFVSNFIKFNNQDNSRLTLDYENVSKYGTSYSISKNSFICGQGDSFTVYFDTVGENYVVGEDSVVISIPHREALVISGVKTESGIKGLDYAFIMLEKGYDPGYLMDEGYFRVFTDEDGVAENASWPVSSTVKMKLNSGAEEHEVVPSIYSSYLK